MFLFIFFMNSIKRRYVRLWKYVRPTCSPIPLQDKRYSTTREIIDNKREQTCLSIERRSCFYWRSLTVRIVQLPVQNLMALQNIFTRLFHPATCKSVKISILRKFTERANDWYTKGRESTKKHDS